MASPDAPVAAPAIDERDFAGQVKWFDATRGFGFVVDGPGHDEDGIPHTPMRRLPR